MTNNTTSSSFLSYILLYLLLALTTFEYFFRYTPLVYVLYCICFLLVFIRKRDRSLNTKDGVYFAVFYSLTFFIVLINGAGISSAFGRILEIIGTLLISLLIYKDFTKHFVNIMVIISLVALVFYGFYFIEPIRDYLFYDVAPNFPSLNMGNFTNELSDTGGGINIVIHNYHNGGASLRTGNLYRNCGPFWEPGQFAVFLNIALFFNIFFGEEKRRGLKNAFLMAALISTFSTGGFSAALFLLFISTLKRSSKFYVKFLAAVVFVVFAVFFVGSEYMGNKIAEEMSSSAEDASRFSAFSIQLRVITDNPIFGGGNWEDYSHASSAANGILLPFVYWGIPFGLVYYFFILRSFKNLMRQNGHKKNLAFAFFSLILILAFSQTIITTRWFLVFIMVGLFKMVTRSNNSLNSYNNG